MARLTNEQHTELLNTLYGYFGDSRMFFVVAMPTFDENEDISDGLEILGSQRSREDLEAALYYAYQMLTADEAGEETRIPLENRH